MLDFSRPEQLDDIAPPYAAMVARCREQALAWFAAHSYQLVIPPLADYLETLTGGDEKLAQQTFKITDTLSGRTLGIRPDQTPQIARFDATMPDKPPQRRYCYCGTTLRTTPPQPWQGREGLQLGAELFGAPAGSGDWEIAGMALGTLNAMGLKDVCIDLGHAGLFSSLVADLPPPLQRTLAGLVEQRNRKALQVLIKDEQLPAALRDGLLALVQNGGGAETLAAAGEMLCAQSIQTLDYVRRQLAAAGHDSGINLSDLGSYGYHSGVVFCVYARDRLIARGGRYQQSGGCDGVGFSIDLFALCDLLPPAETPPPVNVPMTADNAKWRQAVESLRAENRALCFVYEDNPPLPALRQEEKEWRVHEK